MSMQDVLHNYLTSWKVGSNCGILKQALENRPNEFHRVCCSEGVEMKIC